MRTQTKRYDFTPIVDRPPAPFPGKARVAVAIYINLEHFPEDRPGPAIVPHTAHFMVISRIGQLKTIVATSDLPRVDVAGLRQTSEELVIALQSASAKLGLQRPTLEAQVR